MILIPTVCNCLHVLCSYLLYTLDHQYTVSEDDVATDKAEPTPYERRLDTVVSKAVMQSSHLKPIVNDRLRSVIKVKLWRMKKELSNRNKRQREKIFSKWQKSTWELKLEATEVRSALCEENAMLSREQQKFTEDNSRLKVELLSMKREKEDLHTELLDVKHQVAELNEQLLCEKQRTEQLRIQDEEKIVELEHELVLEKEKAERFKSELSQNATCSNTKGQKRKSWDEYSTRHKRRKLEDISNKAKHALNDDQFAVESVTLRNKETGAVQLVETSITARRENKENNSECLEQVLYTKERFGISDAAYHELSMVSPQLPRSWKLKQQSKSLNKQWDVNPTPESTTGVQQSLQSRLVERVHHLLRSSSDKPFEQNKLLRVKLTGDGTYLGSLHVITFGFSLIDEGSVAKSATGYHVLCVLKETESYESISVGLRDVIKEVSMISRDGITVGGCTYAVEFYLGADWKFLAMVCGIDSANSKYACIWCICPKEDRYDTTKEWSITDVKKGARTIKSISGASKLPAKSPRKYNCSRMPLFEDIPIHRVIIDVLHLFLRIADNLINLLITELRRMDGIERCTTLDRSKARNVTEYEFFLQNTCKIPFQFYVCQDSRSLKWRDLTGPEKYKLFQKIDLTNLFPNLPNVEFIQQIWTQFLLLNESIRSETLSSAEISAFASDAKSWLQLFLQVYQTKCVTPYMHALVSHMPQFLTIHGAVNPFTQQGVEKLNDQYTHFYFHSTNHRESDALKQLLLKKNRLEYLTDNGFERTKKTNVCSLCKKSGHNKRTCPSTQCNSRETN